jgi:hypothetical protein
VQSWDSQHSDQFPPPQQKLEAKIAAFKKKVGQDAVFKQMATAFKTLAEHRERESKYLSLYRITETSLRQNFEHLFGFPCDIFARILYLKMTGTKDHAKINFIQFGTIFFDLMDEIKDKRNRCFFSLLDVKGTGILDSMLLMQLFHHIDRSTLLG